MSLNATNLFIQAAPLPATFRGSPNDLFAEMIQRMRILSPSGTNFIFIGDTEPTSNVGPWLKNGTQWYVWDASTGHYIPQDISASFTPAFAIGNSAPASTNPPVWLKTTKDATSTNPLDYGDLIRAFTFDFDLSMWVAVNPVPPGANDIRIWKGSEGELWAYDGGDGADPSAVPPTATSGAMWQVDHDFDFKFPVGAGTNAVVYAPNPASVINTGNTGGEEKHVLLHTELAAHNHNITFDKYTITAGTIDVPAGAFAAMVPTTIGSTIIGNDVAHNTMPPYRGVFFIKRTARVFYTA